MESIDPLAVLALVVVGLYLSECWLLVGHGALVLRRTLFGLRLGAPSTSLGTARAGLVFLHPFPPLARNYVVAPWPFSLSTDGVLTSVSTSVGTTPRPFAGGRVLTWEEVSHVLAEDRELRLAGEPNAFATCASPRHARHCAELLITIATAADKDKRRAKAIDEQLAAATDPDALRAVVKRHGRLGLPLVVCTALCFAAIFVVVPFIVNKEGLEHWPRLLLLVYGTVLPCALSTWVTYKALAPDARKQRWGAALLSVPAPTVAMRGNDKVARDLLAGFHPFAAALALPQKARDPIVHAMLRDLRTPRVPRVLGGDATDARAVSIEATHRARLERAVLDHAKRLSIDLSHVFDAPKMPTGFAAYCPRCHTPYRAAGTCGDCGGLPLSVAQARAT